MTIRYPLLFGRRELVEGDGFIAGVAVSGRALLTQEDEEYWAEGINPGGFSAKGESPGEALAAFSEEFRIVLFDIASSTSDFGAFKVEVERFFNDTNEVALREWESAVAEVRQGKITVDWLTMRPADSPLNVEVVLIDHPKAANNEEGLAALAA
jgi:hypothetical protein